MNMLVTGGGGFLGRYIVEQLQTAGHQVRVFCRGRYPQLSDSGVDVFQGDLQDAAAVSNACRGMEAVFHTAAVPGIWGPWDRYYGTNTIGTENVIRGCRQHAVQRLIYTSSPSVVFDGQDHIGADESLPYPSVWLCHYPQSKALAEQAVLAASQQGGLRTVSLRPHLIWGRRDNHLIPRLMARAQRGRLRRVGDGKNQVSVACVENVAAAHLQAEVALRSSITPNGKAYFINEPEAVNLWDWINQLLQLAGLPPIRKSVSRRTAWQLGGVLEFIYRVSRISGEPPMTRFLAAQLAGSHCYRIDAAQRDFGYSPLITLDEGLRRLQPELQQLARH